MTDTPARVAADLAALLPLDDPLARLARRRLDAAVRSERTLTMTTDPRAVPDEVQMGGRLRDAAVDPTAAGLLPPTNAGAPGELGNPHGRHVVAIEVDDPRRIAAVQAARAAAVTA